MPLFRRTPFWEAFPRNVPVSTDLEILNGMIPIQYARSDYREIIKTSMLIWRKLGRCTQEVSGFLYDGVFGIPWSGSDEPSRRVCLDFIMAKMKAGDTRPETVASWIALDIDRLDHTPEDVRRLESECAPYLRRGDATSMSMLASGLKKRLMFEDWQQDHRH